MRALASQGPFRSVEQTLLLALRNEGSVPPAPIRDLAVDRTKSCWQESYVSSVGTEICRGKVSIGSRVATSSPPGAASDWNFRAAGSNRDSSEATALLYAVFARSKPVRTSSRYSRNFSRR